MHLNWTHENPSDSCWREFVRLHHPVNAVTPELIIPVPIAQGTSRTRSLEKDMTLDPANDAPQLNQQRDMLRSTTKMGLPPAHGEDSCKGSGQLKGRAVLSTGAATRNPDKGTSGRDLNEPILFYAERSFIAGAARQSLLLLLWLPFLLALPEAVPIVLLSALCFTLWQHLEGVELNFIDLQLGCAYMYVCSKRSRTLSSRSSLKKMEDMIHE
jgi:hypothetical protein